MSMKKLKLIEAPQGQEFWLNDGPTLRNLRELKNFLEVITPAMFNHHTKNGRNDFALWVGEVLQDKTASAAIKKAKTITGTRTAVGTALKRYSL